MKTTVRILLSLFSFIASFYFFFWISAAALMAIKKSVLLFILANIISILIAIIVAIYIWKKSVSISKSKTNYILLGGIGLGSIGFIAGFFGPLIFSPSANQGPLLGFFFTGPIGFVLGLIGGAVYWDIKHKKENTIPKQS